MFGSAKHAFPRKETLRPQQIMNPLIYLFWSARITPPLIDNQTAAASSTDFPVCAVIQKSLELSVFPYFCRLRCFRPRNQNVRKKRSVVHFSFFIQCVVLLVVLGKNLNPPHPQCPAVICDATLLD